MKIFLIGLPGSGKTTLGEALAKQLGVEFVDLDNEIVREEGSSIKDIFHSKGETYFRQLERDALRECVHSSGDFVMATGGGVPAHFDNMEFMNAHGVTVFLNLPIEILSKRLKADKAIERPLFANADSIEIRLKQLHEARQKYYRMAKVVIDKESTAEEVILFLPKS